MLKLIFIFVAVSLTGCAIDTAVDRQLLASPNFNVADKSYQNLEQQPESSPTPDEPKYEGVFIDEQFPITAYFSSIDDNGREDEAQVQVSGFTVNIKKYAPRTIERNSKTLFVFKNKYPGDYWGTLVGGSSLLGSGSKQIYVVTSGPGGVCCTNYLITDVSGARPRNIFRSEDYGHFRDVMEVFDAEGDGLYELVQWDSCLRYFMDDCGSCSPEPKVVFKYNRNLREYRPASGIQQDFVKKQMARTKMWIEEKYSEQQATKEVSLDLHRTVLSYVANLLHIGEEKKAWETFNKYGNDSDGKVRKEIERRLASCKFYQALTGKRR
jgi:hypothetical protein